MASSAKHELEVGEVVYDKGWKSYVRVVFTYKQRTITVNDGCSDYPAPHRNLRRLTERERGGR